MEDSEKKLVGLEAWWKGSDEDVARRTVEIAKYLTNLDRTIGFFGTDRSNPSTRFNRPYIDDRKWYQKIEWLQRLARKIVVE